MMEICIGYQLWTFAFQVKVLGLSQKFKTIRVYSFSRTFACAYI